MRLAPLIALSLASLCLAWGASANQIFVRSSSGHVRVMTPRHFHGFHQFGFHQFGFHQFGRFPFNRGAGLAYGYGYAPFGLYGGDYVPPQEPASSPIVMLGQQPPSAPLPSAADLRPSVEETSSGVTIIRGPGSKHIAR
jgi:hypothetical protein